ncbi:MAG: serine/threonine-protein kinase, partial [Myxococcales bacterium]|nr:serine/threonine-protein kinase [Myxococcales bacterium]
MPVTVPQGADAHQPAPAGTADPLIGALVGGRYRIRDVIGQGGMGIVYEAVHEELDRPAALKVLGPAWAADERAIARFQQEARAASNLGHPNIVTIYDFGRLDDGRPYLAMERLRGESLADALDREGSMPARRVAALVQQIARALEAVHAEGLVHRDIKPENIFLARRSGAEECVQLLDFGLAAFSHVPGAGRLTYDGEIQGTPIYMAPETATGERQADRQADLYSLAVVSFEMLSGKVPFDHDNPMQVLHRKCQQNAPSMTALSGCPHPQGLERVLKRALSRDPERRHQSVREFADALCSAASVASFALPARDPLRPTEPERSAQLGAQDSAVVTYDSEPPQLPISRAPLVFRWALAGVLVVSGSAIAYGALTEDGRAPANPEATPAQTATPAQPHAPAAAQG